MYRSEVHVPNTKFKTGRLVQHLARNKIPVSYYLVISNKRQALGRLNLSSCLNQTFIRESSCVIKTQAFKACRVKKKYKMALCIHQQSRHECLVKFKIQQ